MWQRDYSIVAAASPSAVWTLFSDVEGWPAWNAGIERIAMQGPFVRGAEFTMKPPGQPALTSRLVRVEENVGFEDETRVGDVCVRVDHRIEKIDASTVRITYAATVSGPDAAATGEAVTEDFPIVLDALARRVAASGIRPVGPVARRLR